MPSTLLGLRSDPARDRAARLRLGAARIRFDRSMVVLRRAALDQVDRQMRVSETLRDVIAGLDPDEAARVRHPPPGGFRARRRPPLTRAAEPGTLAPAKGLHSGRIQCPGTTPVAMRYVLPLLFVGLTVAVLATDPGDSVAEEGLAPVVGTIPTQGLPAGETCLSPADLREAVADKRVIEPVAAIRAARQVIPRAEIQRARLCRHEDGLVYLLTALRRDGRFVHVMVDAKTGEVTGP